MSTFPLHHFLSIKQLTRDLAISLLDRADHYVTALQNKDYTQSSDFTNRLLITLFFEPSTRTRTSFEIAALRLGARVVNFSVANSSMKKGESFVDTARTLDAMGPDWIVMRHAEAGSVDHVSSYIKAHLINAGDGAHQHPTQALLDALVLRRHFKHLQGLTLLICGDLRHSRVARSQAELFRLLGVDVRLCAPPDLLPPESAFPGMPVLSDFDQALQGCDAVVMLRIQRERMEKNLYPSEKDYHQAWGLDHQRLVQAKPDAVVLHPAPFNRGVEISSELVDDAQRCLVWQQAEAGVAARMAILEALMSSS